jgi:hypothetical protein
MKHAVSRMKGQILTVRGPILIGMSAPRLALLRIRARARAWYAIEREAEVGRAGIRAATPVTAGPRAGGVEGALPTKVPRRRAQASDGTKVFRARPWLEVFQHVLALRM